MLLFSLGASSLVALFLAAPLIRRAGSRRVAVFGTLLLLVFAVLACNAASFYEMVLTFAGTGLGMGFADVACNTQGMLIEARFRSSSMSFLHGAYSFGAVLGSVSGFLFASRLLGNPELPLLFPTPP